MTRGITLKGAAAGAFINTLLGKQPKDDTDKYMRIATLVHMEMAQKNKAAESRARLIIKSLCERGLDRTLTGLTGR